MFHLNYNYDRIDGKGILNQLVTILKLVTEKNLQSAETIVNTVFSHIL